MAYLGDEPERLKEPGVHQVIVTKDPEERAGTWGPYWLVSFETPGGRVARSAVGQKMMRAILEAIGEWRGKADYDIGVIVGKPFMAMFVARSYKYTKDGEERYGEGVKIDAAWAVPDTAKKEEEDIPF